MIYDIIQLYVNSLKVMRLNLAVFVKSNIGQDTSFNFTSAQVFDVHHFSDSSFVAVARKICFHKFINHYINRY